MLFKLFHKLEREGTEYHFQSMNIVFGHSTSKLNKDTTNIENYKPISLIKTQAKTLNKILAD
jgi:hypothetical protein